MINNKFEDEPEEVQNVLKELKKNTVIEKGILYKIIDGRKLIYPQPSARMDIIMLAHKAIGHGGFKKTKEQLQQNYYWESINLISPKL